MSPITGLYAIADSRYLDDARVIPAVRAAIEGGARIIQYRDKSTDQALRSRQASAIASLCHQHRVLFLVNDDVDLAQRIAADGVHLGRDDVSLNEARKQLGPRSVIGVSCYNELERAVLAQEQGANYVAFGSFFASRTKPLAVRAAVPLLHEARLTLHIPVVAIGGITPKNGADLIAAGADALAVIEGVFGQPDVREAAANYSRLFEKNC